MIVCVVSDVVVLIWLVLKVGVVIMSDLKLDVLVWSGKVMCLLGVLGLLIWMSLFLWLSMSLLLVLVVLIVVLMIICRSWVELWVVMSVLLN